MIRNFIIALGLITFVFGAGIYSSAAKAAPPGPTIVDVTIDVNNQTGDFDTLIAALQAADPIVLATLSGNGQHTVFAPTDDAFAALGLDETNVGSLAKDVLTDILLYHVAHGRRDSGDVTSSSQIRMLNGQFTEISVDSSGAYIDNAQIILADVLAANGIIHVIDAVLLPE